MCQVNKPDEHENHDPAFCLNSEVNKGKEEMYYQSTVWPS